MTRRQHRLYGNTRGGSRKEIREKKRNKIFTVDNSSFLIARIFFHNHCFGRLVGGTAASEYARFIIATILFDATEI